MHTAAGLHTDAEEVHVTSGAHQAISLAISALAGKREPIAAETPGYPGFFDILEGLGHRLAPLRADRAGIVPESLAAALTTGGAKVVYVQAAAQNPTGVVTPPSRLRALAAVLDEHDAIVIEDATLAELVFAGPPADRSRPPVPAGHGRLGRVVQQGPVGRAARRLDARRGAGDRPHAAPPPGARPRPVRRRRSC